ncbi:MAG: IS630 family transposase [Anaerolineae bacterium]|jgi:transposase
MNISIRFTTQTVKMLIGRLQHAYRVGDLRLVRRVSALLDLSRGTTAAQVAEIYSVSRQAVYDWLKALMCRGESSLIYRRPAGRKSRLTKTQKQQLRALVEAGPQAAGFMTACWTSVLIQQLIHREFGVLYNRYYVCQLLRNLGFSVQKARFVSDHLDEEARQRWWADTWPQIRRLAEEKRALILFGDEVSFAQWGSLGYSWAPKGHPPTVKTAGKRKGYKVWGLIEFFSGRFFYQGQQERFVSEGYQAFLSQVLAQTTEHLILIQDGARYHTSKATRAFFTEHQDRLSVFQLPSYSPDYNPIEFLWKKMKQRATHNQYFPAFEDLVRAVDEALAYFASQTAEVMSLMGLYAGTQAELAMAA